MPPTTTTITTRLNPNNSQCIPFAQVPCAARLQGRDDDQLLDDEEHRTENNPQPGLLFIGINSAHRRKYHRGDGR